ncbi:hypothetical protein OFM39_36695, partial [Escherichia coli]|nr:hypothetical protein [Escherichia coli]
SYRTRERNDEPQAVVWTTNYGHITQGWAIIAILDTRFIQIKLATGFLKIIIIIAGVATLLSNGNGKENNNKKRQKYN